MKMPRYIIGLRYLFNGPATLQNAYENVSSLEESLSTDEPKQDSRRQELLVISQHRETFMS